MDRLMELKCTITQKGAIFEGKAPEIIQKQLEKAMTEAVSFLEREVKLRTPTGVYGAAGLLGSIHGEVVQKGTPIVKGVVASSSKYGEVVEKGRTAGKAMPPGGAAACALKGQRGRGIKKGQTYYEGPLIRWIEVKFGVDNKTAAKLEWPIRKKIAVKGFEGAHMFENALTENKEKLEEIFNRAGFDIAQKLSEE